MKGGGDKALPGGKAVGRPRRGGAIAIQAYFRRFTLGVVVWIRACS